MLILRPVDLDDLDDLLRMSVEVGPGMTSMPNDEATWLDRIALSKATFSGEVKAPYEEGVYFFVAEDSQTNAVVGTTAIYIGVGSAWPFYSYKKSRIVSYSEVLKKQIHTSVLHLVNDFTYQTEIGSLFLSGDYRQGFNGQFLSRARYLMIADYPELFANDVLAELRGWQDDNGHSPFWQALGKKFFDLPFKNADEVSAVKGTQFISDLMPKYPVYIELLPEDAQAVIGKPHNISAAAVKLLIKEGFYSDGYVDVFDGGPTYHCQKHLIQSVRNTKTYQAVVASDNLENEEHYIVANKDKENYRMALTQGRKKGEEIELSQKILEALQVNSQSVVSVLEIRKKNNEK